MYPETIRVSGLAATNVQVPDLSGVLLIPREAVRCKEAEVIRSAAIYQPPPLPLIPADMLPSVIIRRHTLTKVRASCLPRRLARRCAAWWIATGACSTYRVSA
jgi:hypothetical protein